MGHRRKKNHSEKKGSSPSTSKQVSEQSHKREGRFSKFHEFAIFVVAPAVIVLIFQPAICLLWGLLFVPLIALLDIGRKIATKREWPKWAQVLIGTVAVAAFSTFGYTSIDEHTKPINTCAHFGH